MINMELVEILTIISISLAALGLFANYFQIRKANIQKRAEYIVKLYNDFVNDTDMIDIYYQLEYSDFDYNDNFHGSASEKNLDKLLGHFSNIGRLYFMGILKKKDLKFLEYEFLIIYQNRNIQNYLKFLDDWFKLREINDEKFEYLRKTGKLLESQRA